MFLSTMILMILCSCISRSGERKLYAYLTDRARFVLLPPGGIEKNMDMAQFISASFMGQNHFFNAWVKADKTGMDMTLFNEIGAAMGDLSYKDGIINFSSQVLPGNLQPEYIVADFQLCFYDPVPLRRSLEDCGLSLETQVNTRRYLSEGDIMREVHIYTRRVYDGKNLIMEIEIIPNRVRIVNHLRGYAYTLEGDFE